MDFLVSLWQIIIILNAILALYLVFRRPRSIATTLAWLLVLISFPVLGFILYAFFGRGLAQENLFAINSQEHIGLSKVEEMIPPVPNQAGKTDTTDAGQTIISYFNSKKDAPLTKNNDVSIFTDGHDKFDALFKDIEGAKETINVEYYSFFNDHIGNKFLSLLERKQLEGVQVHLIYDPWGSPGARKSWFEPLTNLGGKVVPFVTARNLIRKYRLNYHLHRKIVVIDGKISWTGGFNVGDQYLGEKKKFGYWRDTHVRIVGSASLLLQERFIMDWNASITTPDDAIIFDTKYFPELNEHLLTEVNVPTQIVSDGPDNDEEFLKNGMTRMMTQAKEKLWIQTPYLIPDDAMIATWQIAARAGVDVRIMIPCMPDHPFIYRATQWYANALTAMGIKIYVYNNGFLHAKTVITDDKFSSFGTMNQDFRSYMLNFEVNAIFYDEAITKKLQDIFIEDMKQSTLLTPEIIKQQSRWLRFKQRLSRLLSPIL
ncbi:cardiolipin synthase [Amylolactobacillus amylophilus]|uniref:Cardiolipin synthase n=1 Tax=Amylolactobacillus amylophilus DSM 20533 = JCM 1125 TaxID=1423721 RepID=A0A0R1YT85_9LACO|nr:cardiolipin synthase [Amylolactobacillus amylophilus]KRM43147.1 cardiolipinsynthetase [Amylolactobacillus amylophilus DSM 20533 = JCM 1125]